MRIIGQNQIGVGDNTASSNKRIIAQTGSTNPSYIDFDTTSQRWSLSNDGLSSFSIGTISTFIDKVVFVSASGNNSTAELGRPDLPYLTFQAAIDSALLAGAGKYMIVGYPGLYDEVVDMKSASATGGFEFNFFLQPGCELIYSGSANQSVIGKYQAASSNERCPVNIYGYGVIKYNGSGNGSGLGNLDTISGFTGVGTEHSIYGAKEISSTSGQAIGASVVRRVENVEKLESTSTQCMSINWAGIQFINSTFIGATRCIHLNNSADVKFRSCTFISNASEAIRLGNVNQLEVFDCLIDAATIGIFSPITFKLYLYRNRIIARNGTGVQIGDNVDRGNTDQAHILYNMIYSDGFNSLTAGPGQNVDATIQFNVMKETFLTGNGAGRFGIEGGGRNEHNSIDNDLTL